MLKISIGWVKKSDWASISGASPRKELLLELIKTAKTYSRQLEQLSEEVLLEVKKLVDEYCTASAAITTGENRPHESVWKFHISIFWIFEWLDKKEEIVTTRLLDRVVKFFE